MTHFLIYAALYGVSFYSHALEFESNAPIEIASDSAEIDDASGTATYKGNVEIIQGKAKLRAALVVVTAPEQVLTRISAEGNPATFNQEFMDQSKLVQTNGQANSIVYKAEEAMLSFEGDAKVVQNLNSFEGNLIVYDLQERAIKAESGPDQESRVKITYIPANFASEQNTSVTPNPSDTPDENPNGAESQPQELDAPSKPSPNETDASDNKDSNAE